MRPEDRTRLRHMLDAARDAVSFAQGRSRADQDKDRQLVMAVVKCVEIIGEAAGSVSDLARAEVPELPWEAMAGMRNRLVHAYYDVNLDVVWSTLQTDLPPLISRLDTLLQGDGV